MPAEVHTLIFNVTGQPTIAPPPRAMRRLEDYVSTARDYGLTDAEIADDVIRQWPSERRDVSVLTQPGGEIWVSLTPARRRPRQRREGQNEPKSQAGSRSQRSSIVARITPPV